MKTNTILLFVSFIIVLTFSSFVNFEDSVNKEKFIVVLDAGHGGKDPGNLGNGFEEKNIALNIVLAIGKELEKNPDIEVVYTRKKDVFIELIDRPKIANEANADLFVSVHCDSHTSQAYGAGTFVMGINKISQNLSVAKKENAVIFLEDNYEEKYAGFDPNSPESLLTSSLVVEEYLDQSILAASFIQKNLVKNLNRKDRNVKQDVFWVLHATFMPSVLVETGFLTNKKEGAYLNSKKGQTEIAREITNGILEFKASINENISFFEDPTQGSITEEIESNYNGIVFKIQIAASSKELETKPYNFKGLNDISRVKEDGLYKYFYGATSNYDEIKKLTEDAKNKGYTSSFVVAYKADKKIPLADALKTTAN
jgi:N-acetylmuramoyl-L-alanine amidase